MFTMKSQNPELKKFGVFCDWEVAQPGRAPGLGPGGRRFESCLPNQRLLSSVVEQFAVNEWVQGSNP